jgi:hypothetical protein
MPVSRSIKTTIFLLGNAKAFKAERPNDMVVLQLLKTVNAWWLSVVPVLPFSMRRSLGRLFRTKKALDSSFVPHHNQNLHTDPGRWADTSILSLWTAMEESATATTRRRMMRDASFRDGNAVH